MRGNEEINANFDQKTLNVGHNNSTNLKVAVDLDGVLWDLHSAGIREFTKHDIIFDLEKFTHHDFHDNCLSSDIERVKEAGKFLWNSEEFYKNLQPIPDGWKMIVDLLSFGCELHFYTSRNYSLFEVTASKMLQESWNWNLAIGHPSIHCFGSTAAKAQAIVQNGFDAVIEDNAALFHLLRELDFQGKNYLLKQHWNSGEKFFRRFSYDEVVKELCSLQKMEK